MKRYASTAMTPTPESSKVSAAKRMTRPGAHRVQYGEAPMDHLQSEADNQMQTLLQKQLSKSVALESELEKTPKRFSSESYLQDGSKARAGLHTLESFQTINEKEKALSSMQEKGLTGHEIILATSTGEDQTCHKATKMYGKSEVGLQDTLKAIDLKIGQRNSLIRTPDVFTATKTLSRREMEIEQSHYRGTEKADQLKHLVTFKLKEYPENDPVLLTLKEYEKKQDNNQINDSDDETEFIGPVLAHVNRRVTSLDESIIKRNCMSLEEIKKMSKFANYSAGPPSKTLYLKNLSKSTAVEELAKLFCRYDNREDPVMEYRIMTGRMREQAFVTFKDIESAKMGLELANGFILHGKPLVIQYGRCKEQESKKNSSKSESTTKN